jgi:hypothetical protein
MSEKQNEANLRNAQRSTGPVTAAGKAISARNAVKFGLWGREALIAGEDPKEFKAFRAGYVADLRPVGTVEFFHVEQVVTSAWRLRRVRRLEAQVFAEQNFPEPDKAATPGRAFLTDCRGLNALSKLARDESRIERSYYRALHELQRLQAVRDGQVVPAPLVAEIDVNMHGGDMEESLLHQLEPDAPSDVVITGDTVAESVGDR